MRTAGPWSRCAGRTRPEGPPRRVCVAKRGPGRCRAGKGCVAFSRRPRLRRATRAGNPRWLRLQPQMHDRHRTADKPHSRRTWLRPRKSQMRGEARDQRSGVKVGERGGTGKGGRTQEKKKKEKKRKKEKKKKEKRE